MHGKLDEAWKRDYSQSVSWHRLSLVLRPHLVCISLVQCTVVHTWGRFGSGTTTNADLQFTMPRTHHNVIMHLWQYQWEGQAEKKPYNESFTDITDRRRKRKTSLLACSLGTRLHWYSRWVSCFNTNLELTMPMGRPSRIATWWSTKGHFCRVKIHTLASSLSPKRSFLRQ